MLIIAGLLESGWANGQAAGSTTAPPDAPNGATEVDVSFDVATVEELALYFATESIRRLRIPLPMRLLNVGKNRWSRKDEIERVRANPPKVDADGVAYPLGDKNPLSFVFDPETGTLGCWERIVKKRGKIDMLGLTGPEMAAALNAVSSRDGDRGGADFAYDPIRDALSLHRSYRQPPSDRERFYKDIDRLVESGLKWVEGRYLENALAIVESRRPPASATASAEGFTATLVLRHFSAQPPEDTRWVERYRQAWDRPHGGPAPRLISDRDLAYHQHLHAYIHFQGARGGSPDGEGIDASFLLISPRGDHVFTDRELPIWRGDPPPADHLQIGINHISFSLDESSPTGTYRLEARVCETGTERCVALTHAFELRSE